MSRIRFHVGRLAILRDRVACAGGCVERRRRIR